MQKSQFQKGVSLLLVVVLLSALLSVSIGIFNVVLGQIRISGEIADSFIALYAADQSIEKILYLDRIKEDICEVEGPDCYVAGPVDVSSGGCYFIRVSKTGSVTEITAAGQYRCGTNPVRVVKRGLQVTY